MPRDRFKKLSTYFHINDNTTAVPYGQPGYNPLHKVEPLLTSVRQHLLEQFNPGQNIAIDEAMVAFKGRSFMKQYLPGKPIKWGFKIWTLADSVTGYVSDIDVYTGRRQHPSGNGLGYDVVMGLARPFLNRYHHIYFDNYFSSLKLASDLLDRGTYSCGTLRANRVGIPAVIKKPGRLARGESIKRQCGNILCVVWRDKRDVRLIATNSQPTDTTVQRRDGRALKDVACPQSVVNYNKNMGGVDLSDQNRSYYDVGRQAKKYWKQLVWYLINLCTVNSYVIYQQTMAAAHQPAMKHLLFRENLIDQLIGGFSSRKRAGRTAATPIIEACHLPGHELVKAEKKLSCKNCSQLGKKTPAGRYVQTTFKCNMCNVHLCKDGCLVEFHTRHANM